jgi:phosphoribosylanthranilate isomerase
MLIKVCGIKNKNNLDEIITLSPDLIGFIFYPKSSRYIGTELLQCDLEKIPKEIKKTGVFVNEKKSVIQDKASEYGLDLIQLHGDESPSYCQELNTCGFDLIKAFHIESGFDFSITQKYSPFCRYFLFDTKGKEYGGNGLRFNWLILDNYNGETPFFLSGGINPDCHYAINSIEHKSFEGIDINSGFETKPGIKDLKVIKEFVKRVR